MSEGQESSHFGTIVKHSQTCHILTPKTSGHMAKHPACLPLEGELHLLEGKDHPPILPPHTPQCQQWSCGNPLEGDLLPDTSTGVFHHYQWNPHNKKCIKDALDKFPVSTYHRLHALDIWEKYTHLHKEWLGLTFRSTFLLVVRGHGHIIWGGRASQTGAAVVIWTVLKIGFS